MNEKISKDYCFIKKIQVNLFLFRKILLKSRSGGIHVGFQTLNPKFREVQPFPTHFSVVNHKFIEMDFRIQNPTLSYSYYHLIINVGTLIYSISVLLILFHIYRFLSTILIIHSFQIIFFLFFLIFTMYTPPKMTNDDPFSVTNLQHLSDQD